LDSNQSFTAAEQKVASIWTKALGCEVPGPMANFMDLGGSSLLAAQVAKNASDQFGTKISVVDVIVASSLREFVDEIKTA
jgi:hypothetical protein